MSDDRELLEIQQQLEEIMQRIGRTFNIEYPKCNDIYEDVGAAVYCIEQAGYPYGKTPFTFESCCSRTTT